MPIHLDVDLLAEDEALQEIEEHLYNGSPGGIGQGIYRHVAD